jgi:hypothetical protein
MLALSLLRRQLWRRSAACNAGRNCNSKNRHPIFTKPHSSSLPRELASRANRVCDLED